MYLVAKVRRKVLPLFITTMFLIFWAIYSTFIANENYSSKDVTCCSENSTCFLRCISLKYCNGYCISHGMPCNQMCTCVPCANRNEEEEPNDYFFPKGYDNTKPLDESNLLKELPIYGCTHDTDLLVGIKTRTTEFTEREWIRNNWGRYRSPQVPLIFLIGNTNNQVIRNSIIEEKQKYGDILLLNFDDHYLNQSVKNYGFFKYFVEYCPNANCLVKADSDTVININGLERMCNLSSTNKKVMTGCMAQRTEVNRIPGPKWYVPRYVYPNKKYDDYLDGWGMLVTGKNSVKDLLDTLRNKTPFLTSENYRRIPEDAIQNGEVRILANISIQDVGGFGNGEISFWIDPITNKYIPLITTTTDDKKEAIWRNFKIYMKRRKQN